MKKAETYLELWAECPSCGEHQSVEYIYSGDDAESTCTKCGEGFKYSGVDQ